MPDSADRWQILIGGGLEISVEWRRTELESLELNTAEAEYFYLHFDFD